MACPRGGSWRREPMQVHLGSPVAGSKLPSPGRPPETKPSHIVDRPWFHLPIDQGTPPKAGSPRTAAAIVPHSSSWAPMPESPRTAPDMPAPHFSATWGALVPAVIPGARKRCPTISSNENMTLASRATEHFDCSVTRKTATGKPLTSSSPGTNALHASTTASTGALSSRRVTRPYGKAVSNTQYSNLGKPPRGTGDPSAPSTSSGNISPSRMSAFGPTPGPLTRQARNVPPAVDPLAGWFSSSQSRNWPRPPKPTEPVPIPPNGSDMARRWRPWYERRTGQVLSPIPSPPYQHGDQQVLPPHYRAAPAPAPTPHPGARYSATSSSRESPSPGCWSRHGMAIARFLRTAQAAS